jgi:hypothetical protein
MVSGFKRMAIKTEVYQEIMKRKGKLSFSEFLSTMLSKPISEIPKTENTQETLEIPCSQLIQYQGNYYCVKHPPKVFRLLSLQICQVCRKMRYNPIEPNVSEKEAWYYDLKKQMSELQTKINTKIQQPQPVVCNFKTTKDLSVCDNCNHKNKPTCPYVLGQRTRGFG